MQCSEIISWVERHYDLLSKVDIVNLLLKNSWWAQKASFYFRGLEYSGCWHVGAGRWWQKVLFRAD